MTVVRATVHLDINKNDVASKTFTQRQDKAELKKIIINQCQMAKLAIILLLAWFLRYRMRPFMACILKKYHRETEHHVNQQSPAKGTTQINSIP